MFAEETLLSYRVIHEENYKIYNVPSSKVIHFEGSSFKGVPPFKAKAFINGNYIYFSKVFGVKEAIKYLKLMARIYKRKLFLSNFYGKSRKEEYRLFYDEFKNFAIVKEKEIK